jgi:hypothetical protein
MLAFVASFRHIFAQSYSSTCFVESFFKAFLTFASSCVFVATGALHMASKKALL